MSLSRYVAEDADRTVHYGPDDDYNDVKNYAQEHNLLVVEYVYEFSDTNLIDDFTADSADSPEEYDEDWDDGIPVVGRSFVFQLGTMKFHWPS